MFNWSSWGSKKLKNFLLANKDFKKILCCLFNSLIIREFDQLKAQKKSWAQWSTVKNSKRLCYPTLILLWLEVKNNQWNSYSEIFSDYKLWLIRWVNPIISDDWLWNLCWFPTLVCTLSYIFHPAGYIFCTKQITIKWSVYLYYHLKFHGLLNSIANPLFY